MPGKRRKKEIMKFAIEKKRRVGVFTISVVSRKKKRMQKPPSLLTKLYC